MIRYEITHDDSVLYTLCGLLGESVSPNNPQTEINLVELILKLSDDNVGVFVLWGVDFDPETGREKYVEISTAKNGVEI